MSARGAMLSGDPQPGVPRARAPELDLARMHRALGMKVRRCFTDPPEELPFFQVYNPRSDSSYTCTLEPVLRCDCADATMRGVVCKHLCACLFIEKDPEAIRLAQFLF